MENRYVIQWDKDDLEELGLMKVDVLALGMLSALRRALDLLGAQRGRSSACTTFRGRPRHLRHDVRSRYHRRVPDRIARADEHAAAPAAQEFYDLVIEVAIVRPGPIQGGMVHPYLQRRMGRRRSIPPAWKKRWAARWACRSSRSR
jgi:error-prone DNA polymerase